MMRIDFLLANIRFYAPKEMGETKNIETTTKKHTHTIQIVAVFIHPLRIYPVNLKTLFHWKKLFMKSFGRSVNLHSFDLENVKDTY